MNHHVDFIKSQFCPAIKLDNFSSSIKQFITSVLKKEGIIGINEPGCYIAKHSGAGQLRVITA